mgnify:FL=1
MAVTSIRRREARLLVGVALVAACQAAEPETLPPPSPETEIQLEPQLPTGVQLQASFAVPGMLDGQPEEFPFRVVSPQASPGGTWWTEDALPILDALLGEVRETYRVDPDRVYLTGLGEVQWTLYEDEGHIGTFERAYRDPQLYLWLLEHQR